MTKKPRALTPAQRDKLIAAAMGQLAKIKTPARAAASRRNGQLGGRPRKCPLDKPSR